MTDGATERGILFTAMRQTQGYIKATIERITAAIHSTNRTNGTWWTVYILFIAQTTRKETAIENASWQVRTICPSHSYY